LNKLAKFCKPISPFGSSKALRTTVKTGIKTKIESRMTAIMKREKENLSIDRRFLSIVEMRFFICSFAPKLILPVYQVAVYLVNYLKGLMIWVLGKYENMVKE